MSETTNQPTNEEIAQYQKKQDQFLEDNLPLVRKQSEYYECLAKIEISKLRAYEAKLQYASLVSQSTKKENEKK